MTTDTLVPLLVALRDGSVDPEVVAAARASLRACADVPDDLRAALDDDDDIAGTAGALLVMLGVDDGFGDALMSALLDEAGPVGLPDVAAAIVADVPPVAGVASSSGTPEASEVLEEPWLPVADAVRAEAGMADVADSVLEALGHAPLGLTASVRAEAGVVSVERAVLERVGASAWVDVAAAVRREAGVVDLAEAVAEAIGASMLPVAAAVRDEAGEAALVGAALPSTVAALLAPELSSGLLDNELPERARRAAASTMARAPSMLREMAVHADLGRELRLGVRDEAGDAPSLWPAVAQAVGVPEDRVDEVAGYDGAAVADAVRAEAGSVDVAEAVMARVRRASAAPAAAVAAPASSGRWSWGSAVGLLAAAAAVVVLWQGMAPAPSGLVATEVVVAAADPVQLEALDYAEDAVVQVITPEDGSLIIWFDEGATL
jgi:hypothetical protein